MNCEDSGQNTEMNPLTKIVLMRHAETTWNKALNNIFVEKDNKEIDEETFIKKHKELTKSQDPDVLNAALNPKGHEQCELASKKIPEDHANVKRVLISPMRRTIQTFEESFKNHPNFLNKTMKISFIPEMREKTNSACDIACWTQNEKDCFKNFEMYDWSWENEFDDAMKPFWFLDTMLDFEKERALSAIKDAETVEEKRIKLLENLIDGSWFPWNYESKESSENRIKEAQKKISKIIIDEGLKDNELAIVSHCGTQQAFTSISNGENSTEGIFFKNAETRVFEFPMYIA